MTDAAQARVWTGSLRRLSLLATLLAAFAFAIVFIMLVPLRVAECGPPDPHLLRYLGAPLFHSTGYGMAASLEAQIWAGPWMANIALVASAVFGLLALARRGMGRIPSPAFLWAVVLVSSVLMCGAAWIVVEAHNVLWTLASPEVSAQTCDIRVDPFTDTRAWVTP